ncbi:MAG: fibronectin type III domain-containing protein [Bacteroidota bacterium]|nr:MAG: fibronectin type III domain-containing protein [Bacteroidota bacterium]
MAFVGLTFSASDTMGQCAFPTGISASPTSTTVTVSWTAAPNAAYYQVRYRIKTPTGSWMNGTSSTTSKTFTGLNDLTTYEYQVQTICNSPAGSSSYSPIQEFTTLAKCPTPSITAVWGITSTGANISWTATGAWYATRYRVSPSGSWVNGPIWCNEELFDVNS